MIRAASRGISLAASRSWFAQGFQDGVRMKAKKIRN
jgi:hypothetical protein